MKRVTFLTIVLMSLIFNTFLCYCSETPIDTVISQITNFEGTIDIETDDLSNYIVKIFETDPKLEFYYNGYSGTGVDNSYTIQYEYTNTNIPYNRILTAFSQDDLEDVLKKALLYCEEDVYIICGEGLDVEGTISDITGSEFIIAMGYNGYNSHYINSTLTGNQIYKLNFKYSMVANELVSYKQQTENKAVEILCNNVAKSMPNYLKELIIHDYIVDNYQYSTNITDISHTPYSLLVNGDGVCSAYAQSMDILLNMVDIDTLYVTGTATNSSGTENHAWNIVNIDGEYYNVDATWDDPVGYSLLSLDEKYKYFNVTDAELAADHSWDRSEYPSCSSNTYNHHNIVEMEKFDDFSYSDYYTPRDFQSIFDEYKPNDYNQEAYNIYFSDDVEENESHYTQTEDFSAVNNTLPYICLIIVLIIFIERFFK